jgi:hypothetical protein
MYPIIRDGIHTNGLRNRLIAKLVRTLITSDQAKLAEKYPAVAALVDGRVSRTVVYVDNAGHGLKLAHELRLPLLVDVLANRAALTSADLRALDWGARDADDPGRPMVVTTRGLQHLGHFDVLVRADGGMGPLPLPARHLRNTAGDNRELLVIDFKDADVPLLRHRSGLRAKAYRDSRWTILGEPLPSPLERFKAERPEVFR